MNKLKEETLTELQRSKSMAHNFNFSGVSLTEGDPILSKGSLPNMSCANCNAGVSVEQMARMRTPKPGENNLAVVA